MLCRLCKLCCELVAEPTNHDRVCPNGTHVAGVQSRRDVCSSAGIISTRVRKPEMPIVHANLLRATDMRPRKTSMEPQKVAPEKTNSSKTKPIARWIFFGFHLDQRTRLVPSAVEGERPRSLQHLPAVWRQRPGSPSS